MTTDDEHVRELAREILRQSEFARHRFTNPELPAWLEQLLEWFGGLFGTMHRLQIEQPVLYFAVLIGLTLVALGLIAHVIYTIRRAMSATVVETPPPVVVRHVDLAQRAHDEAHRGAYLEAARAMHLACLDFLLERGWLELSRADPNAVLRTRIEATALPAAEKSRFSSLLDRLELQCFRAGRAEADLYQAWRRLYDRLRLLEQPR